MPAFWDSVGGEVFGDGIVSIWDRFVVSGRALPGVAQVDGLKSCRLDVRNSAGSDGGTLSHLGNDNSGATVRLRMWTKDQLDEWARRVPELLAATGKARPSPVMVYHPALALFGIKALYVKEVGLIQVKDGMGEVVIKFLEFLPVSKAGVVTPKAAINTAVPSAFGAGAVPAAQPPSKAGAGPKP